MSVVVYFETPKLSYSEVVAKFSSEEIYNACLPMLKNIAKKDGFIVTESVKGEPTIDQNDITDICIQIMDFLSPEEEEDDSYDFEAQDEVKKIVEAWLRRTNTPFEESQ
jgi:hypothetical protein